MMQSPDSPINPRTPVLVGIGVSSQRCADGEDARDRGKEAWELMADACEIAAADAGSLQLLNDCQQIAVPKGMWSYTDPARLIANHLGATSASTVLANIGILQQTLLGQTCQQIMDGELDIAIVTGGEAKHRQLMGTIAGIEIGETPQTDQPDVTLSPEDELWLAAETNAGLGMPVGYYAIMESAYRHHQNLPVESHRDQIAALYHQFSKVAASNPDAWNQQEIPPEQIRNAVGKNKMLAFPYTKKHNSSWNVDQASAMIFCSVEKATALGIDPKRWVYPLCSTESNQMLPVTQREKLHELPGAIIAGNAALKTAGITAADIDLIDLYSCFPIAVETYQQALGLPSGKALTVTGGMAFAGGPLNNYLFQSTCKLVEQLRKHGGIGLTSCVSGMLTKQAFGIWSTEPKAPFKWVDVTTEVEAINRPKNILEAYNGPATIVGYTVLYQGDFPERLVAVADNDEGNRVIIYSQSKAIISRGETEELCGKRCLVNSPNLIAEVD